MTVLEVIRMARPRSLPAGLRTPHPADLVDLATGARGRPGINAGLTHRPGVFKIWRRGAGRQTRTGLIPGRKVGQYDYFIKIIDVLLDVKLLACMSA